MIVVKRDPEKFGAKVLLFPSIFGPSYIDTEQVLSVSKHVLTNLNASKYMKLIPRVVENSELKLLFRTTLESWPDNSWCIRASLFGSFGQLDGTAGVVSGTDNVLIKYSRSADGLTWYQNVTNALTGSYLSSFAHTSGPMTGWGTGTECDSNCSGTIATQVYKNTTIKLASADASFIKTLSTSGGTTYSGLKMSADGKTLTIDKISVPAMV
ncbi:hypothetical protein G7Y89_g15350 [Cudoniella acicularis]|uniref:Uncharacterized protein n=1 Tax=Cudoniella acicularis TaxID=354080 RepID=A0A8H4QNG7_9HELO|nr:hypothetical protein G7Y89_g15350 [Cudoniella acicularis]